MSPPKDAPLADFVGWFRNDLAYKTPELWPARIDWFLGELVARYGSDSEEAL